MKKFMIILFGLILVFSMAGCGAETAPEDQATEESKVQLANPYITCDDIQMMEKLAGMKADLPGNLPAWATETIYRTIPEELIEVIYAGEGNEIRVRIAEGTGDISGVYDSDPGEEVDVSVGENTVHLKGVTGEDGTFLVFVSTWLGNNGRTYSVTSTKGVPQETLVEILKEIR